MTEHTDQQKLKRHLKRKQEPRDELVDLFVDSEHRQGRGYVDSRIPYDPRTARRQRP